MGDDKEIRDLLNIYNEEFFERKIGKKRSDWSREDQLMYIKSKSKVYEMLLPLLTAAGDTYESMPWNLFLERCDIHGFEIVYRVEQPSVIPELFNEEEVILVNEEMGFVIYAYSDFNKQVLNEGTLWGEVREFDGVDSLDTAKSLLGIINYKTENDTKKIELEVSTGLFTRLGQLDGFYDFVVPWTTKADLFFATSDDCYDPNIEFFEMFERTQKITAEKVGKLPQKTREIMGIEPEKQV